MSPDSDWLPSLIELEGSGGDWDKYEAKLYGEFRRDFIMRRTQFRGENVVVLKLYLDGKETCFWHCTSEGEAEQDRTPDLRKCERIAWLRPVIEAAGTSGVIWWLNKRKTSTRAVISLPDFSYVVVLEKRSGYWLLKTAYPVEQAHRRRKLQAEYERTDPAQKG